MFEKYSKYMPLNVSNYQESLFVKSSSIERCLTAARSFLDGFLSASKESSVISNDIPIDYLPLEQDDVSLFVFKIKQKIFALISFSLDPLTRI